MKKHFLFVVLLTMLIFASCLAVGESTEPASSDSGEKQFDVTKAVKLENGVNDVGVVPGGYVLVSFTLYTPEEYTCEERADFRLEGRGPQNDYFYFFEDIIPSEEVWFDEAEETDEDAGSGTQEGVTYSLVCSTDNINYYIQDGLQSLQIPHRSKENYTLAELASDVMEILKKSEVLLNTSSNLLAGADHRDSELLDLDHNRKLDVFIGYSPDRHYDGYVRDEDVQDNHDCLYMELNGFRTYVESDAFAEEALEINVLDTFVHEYAHLVQLVYNDSCTTGDFMMEGFADAVTAIVKDAQTEVQIPAEMHDTLLFDEFFMSHPKDGQLTSMDYSIGGRFWYYMYMIYHLDEPYPYRSTLEKMVTMNDVDRICYELAGRDFKDLYREFFLSVFAGNGVDFGPEVTPFSATDDIMMDDAHMIQRIYTSYRLNEGWNIYRYEDTPIEITGLPGCSFVIAEWDQCPRTFIYTPSDDHVETWVFALKE